MKRALVASLVFAACSHDSTSIDASTDASPKPASDHALAAAEDQRRTPDVTEVARHDPNPRVRRRAARALARIADSAAAEALVGRLADDDTQTVAWAAYGLGFACKGREEATVRALVARAVSLPLDATNTPLDVRSSIARAIGRCGGGLAEATLSAWVKGGGPFAESSAIALGDIAVRRGKLDEETVTVLLDVAEKGHDEAFYPFGRLDKVDDAFSSRLEDAAKTAIAKPMQATRVFAVRALAKAGPSTAPELGRIAADASLPIAERADAARSLGKLSEPGHVAAALALAEVLPAHATDPFEVLRLGADDFAIALALTQSIGDRANKDALPVLNRAANLRAPGVPDSLGRRLATLRCAAAAVLANGVFDAEVLRSCDAPGTIAFERGRLASIVRRPLSGDRKSAWLTLTTSKNTVIVEAAIEAIEGHAELGEAARTVLATSLGDERPGVVATAATVIHSHPERVLVLSAIERKRALDPSLPPPTTHPQQDPDPLIAAALNGALAKPWKDSLPETRVALLEAAVAVKLPSARAWADVFCKDANATIRERAVKALRTLGEVKPACPAPAEMPLAPELASVHGGKLTLETDSGTLSITFDPELAPVASTRLIDLAKAGFFKGIVVHRVVPGFVVQFGDPGGDGYGGADKLLRCETSPVPFGALDVGVALAGRDTGSSQIFVTLARFPHLDGDYARIGHAQGDWASVAEGDVVREARVDDDIVAPTGQ